MAGLVDLLQRISRSLEEAGAQQPGDDLRARLGYGAPDDDEDDLLDAALEPETAEPGSARAPLTAMEPETVSEASRMPAPATAVPRTSGRHRAPSPNDGFGGIVRDTFGGVLGDGPSSPAAPSSPHASPASLLSERIRARLRTPDALREAFVVKEVLDRPLGRRGGRQEGRGR